MDLRLGIGRLALWALLLGGVTFSVFGCAGDGPRTSTAIYFGAQGTTATVFGVPEQEEEGEPEEKQLGRGVVVDEGIVATACHVIDGLSPFVVLNDRREGEVIESVADLCLLELVSERSALEPIEFASAYDLLPGQRIYLIGSIGVEDSVFSAGEVVGFARDSGGWSPGNFLLVYTADIARGSSGGPVLDERGRLVGITVAKTEDQ
ncbi:serine protease, partial [Halorhodospira sp. 9622]|uniref:S1 family peptidase n=1 Tax=Halorhodospira sp. 9622 TaxID=2899136 RepID=UPI001EE98FB6|nr:serine protease [Halorhodospira sp. 9622]